MHIDHINIRAPMSTLELERRFFCDIFNFNVGFRPEFNDRGYWLYDNDSAVIHLTESDRNTINERSGCFDHVAFKHTEFCPFIKNLSDFDISYSKSNIPELGITQVFLESPAGLRIEVIFSYVE